MVKFGHGEDGDGRVGEKMKVVMYTSIFQEPPPPFYIVYSTWRAVPQHFVSTQSHTSVEFMYLVLDPTEMCGE